MSQAEDSTAPPSPPNPSTSTTTTSPSSSFPKGGGTNRAILEAKRLQEKARELMKEAEIAEKALKSSKLEADEKRIYNWMDCIKN
jgi:hypothetical protein